MGELVVTNKGKELIAKLIQGSETINFTRIKTSIHDYSGDNLEDLTDIEEVKQESMISSVEKTDNTIVEVIAMINNSTLQEGYYIKTIGLYAQDSNSNEILYGVSIAGKYPDYMPSYGGKTVSSISYKLITKVDNSEQVNIEINPSAIPTITQINELKQVVIETKELFNKHISEEIASEKGSHGFKYDENELKLKYKKNGAWKDIPIGQQAETEINKHKEKSILNAEGVHDLKYDESSQKFKYKKDGTWNDINTSGNTQGLEEHKGKSILNVDGVHGFKCDGNEIFCYDNSSWRNIDVTSKHREVRVIGGDGVHGIKFDTSDKRLKYKNNSNNWENIPTGQEEIDEHVKIKVNSVEGIHGLRYHDNKLQHYNESSQNWENVKQDVLVTGLTADVLKVGTTAVIETEGEELKRVTGTFTGDANAVASDIISGKTAYVNGNKITGNIVSKSGDQSIGTPSVSGNYLYTPNIPNGNYNNTRFYFNKGNLLPENIKQGVNIFGVNGNLKGGDPNGTLKLVYQLYRSPNNTNICWQIFDETLASSDYVNSPIAPTHYKGSWNGNSSMTSESSGGAGRIRFKRQANLRVRKFGSNERNSVGLGLSIGTWGSANITDNREIIMLKGDEIKITSSYYQSDWIIENYCFFEV